MQKALSRLPQRRLLKGLFAGLVATLAGSVQAVTVDGGDYAYMPHGSTLGVVYQQHFGGRDLYAKGRKVSGDAKLSVDLTMLRGVWYRDWGDDHAVVPQFLVPIGRARTGGELAGQEATNGIGDLLLVFPLHFIKDPSGRNAFSISPWLWLPTGNYNADNALNPFAENRWKLAFQVGRNWKVSESISLELVGDVQFHSANRNFGVDGTTLTQRPLWELQTHLRYFLSAGTFVGGMVSHITGGETRVDGVAQNDRQSLTKVLFTVGHFLDKDIQLLISYGQDVSIRTGIKEDARFNLRLLKLFGR